MDTYDQDHLDHGAGEENNELSDDQYAEVFLYPTPSCSITSLTNV